MNIEHFVLGPLENNAYVIQSESKEAVVVDAPMGIEPLVAYLKDSALTVTAVLLTHGHFDHMGGVETIRECFKVPVYLHEDEKDYLDHSQLNGGAFFGYPCAAQPPDELLTDETVLRLAGMEIQVIHTPGHTPGGTCFLIDDCLFSGDTLFRFGVGRTDLPDGSERTLIKSIVSKLFSLPPTTRVFPGHGPATVLDKEMRLNPFLRGWRG